MNKKVNSVLFILGATLANVLIMILLFILFLFIHLRFIAPLIAPETAQLLLIVIFFLTIGLTYVIYNSLMKLIAKRIDLEKYFDPLLQPKRRK